MSWIGGKQFFYF